ncbi:hydrogenase expression protein HypA [Streptomyces sp. NPDC003635]
MSRGEEPDRPDTGADSAVPEEEPVAPHYEVVISGEDSAAVDGEPVVAAEGVTLDAAILDLLHEYARERDTAVTADISDPSVGCVASVEVSPDGSSRLLEEFQETSDAGEGVTAAGDAEPQAEPHAEPHAEPGDGLDDEPHGLPHPAPEPPPLAARPAPEPARPPAREPAPASRIGRRNAPRQSDDEFEGPGLLQRPLVIAPVALGVATLVIVPLVMLGSGGSGGGDETRNAGAKGATSPSRSAGTVTGVPAPTVSVSPSNSPSPSPSATKKDKAKDKAKEKDKASPTPGGEGAGEVVVTVTARPPRATVTARPPRETAATAVNRLARSDPGGRHICYRVYLSAGGWQKPVCDGTMAGTTGQNKPIKAVNIAVTGAGGSAANAFRHDPASTNGEGKWVKQWTAVVADGRNNYIGSTSSGAPYLTGFAVNIGSGRICPTAKVRGYDWGGQDCADQRPDFAFGGTLENTRWLEAVKFTV